MEGRGCVWCGHSFCWITSKKNSATSLPLACACANRVCDPLPRSLFAEMPRSSMPAEAHFARARTSAGGQARTTGFEGRLPGKIIHSFACLPELSVVRIRLNRIWFWFAVMNCRRPTPFRPREPSAFHQLDGGTFACVAQHGHDLPASMTVPASPAERAAAPVGSGGAHHIGFLHLEGVPEVLARGTNLEQKRTYTRGRTRPPYTL